MCWSRKDIVWYKSHCGSWTWLESSAEVPVGSSMLDTFLTLLNLSTSCVHWVVTSQQCNLQRGVRSPTWRLSSQWCLCRIWSLYHRDMGVSWQLLSKPHVLHHTISLTTWNGFAAHYFIRTKLFWSRKFAIIKNRTKNFTCFFSLVTSFWVTWSSSTGTFF